MKRITVEQDAEQQADDEREHKGEVKIKQKADQHGTG